MYNTDFTKIVFHNSINILRIIDDKHKLSLYMIDEIVTIDH